MKRAIVLSGGGAQGAYQIGVWKALRKLHIKYDVVKGTSVGAMNGALMVQNDYYRAVWMWHYLNFNFVFSEKLENDYKTPDGKKEIVKMYAKNILLNGGMDVSRLEETLNKNLNLRKFYKSRIDYGLVMVKLPSLKAVMLTKHQIPRYQLKDYIMASATCFPAFKKKEINNEQFIDGGYYDNLPINLAIDMHADEIIAVDLNTIGFKKRVKKKNIKITYITPRNKLGSFLVFHESLSRRNIKFGYNDTMKTFKKLDGNKYTFKLGHLKSNFDRYQYQIVKHLVSIINFPEQSKTVAEKLIRIINYQQVINGSLKSTNLIINKTIEYAGKALEIDDSNIYNINYFNHLLVKKIKVVNDLNMKLVEQKIKNNDIISLLDTGLIIKYVYNKMLVMTNDIKTKKELCKIALLFSKEFMCALYIFVISKDHKI